MQNILRTLKGAGAALLLCAAFTPAHAALFRAPFTQPVTLTLTKEHPVARPKLAALSTPVLVEALPITADGYAPWVDRSGPPVQCVPYARARTGVSLYGKARAWWTKAAGLYRRSHAPETGAVMVMGGTRYGHVAVVTTLLDSRRILVDHANWQNRGEITRGALVEDVSAGNDWSAVRVWYAPANHMGGTAYPVFGFVHPDAPAMAQTPSAGAPG